MCDSVRLLYLLTYLGGGEAARGGRQHGGRPLAIRRLPLLPLTPACRRPRSCRGAAAHRPAGWLPPASPHWLTPPCNGKNHERFLRPFFIYATIKACVPSPPRASLLFNGVGARRARYCRSAGPPRAPPRGIPLRTCGLAPPRRRSARRAPAGLYLPFWCGGR